MEAVRHRHRERARTALAELLEPVEWDAVLHLTAPRAGVGQRQMIERWRSQAASWAQAAASPVPPWIALGETGELGDRPHLHCLTRLPRRLRPERAYRRKAFARDQADRWPAKAEAELYRPGAGIEQYIPKDFGHPSTEMEMSHNARRALATAGVYR